MTKPDFHQPHPFQSHKPNLFGHEQKQAGKATLRNTLIRHDNFTQRFFNNKDSIIKDAFGHFVFDTNQEIIPRSKKKR